MLVDSNEVQRYFEEINEALGLSLKFTNEAKTWCLLLNFPGDGTPRPRYLGICHSKSEFNNMQGALPSNPDPAGVWAPMADGNDDTAQAWRDKTIMAAQNCRAPKSKPDPETKKNMKARQREQNKLSKLS